MRYVASTISLFIGVLFLAPVSAHATAYYIDFNAAGGGAGTSTTSPYNSLDAFTEVARSAGDIAFVRRNAASTTGVSDLNFTSDGTIANPIIITADYDNLWGDFASSSQTYTVNIASSTFVGSASTTGIVAGDWVYVEGDCYETYAATTLNQCEFAYEVAGLQSNVIYLYLPYKGNQSGSGKTLRKMGSNPQWNVASGDFQWNFDTDDAWLVKGIDVRGTDSNGNIEIDSSSPIYLVDMIFIGDGTTDRGVSHTDDYLNTNIYKTRSAGHSVAPMGIQLSDVYGTLQIKDSYFQGSSASACIISASATANHANLYVYDTYCISGFPAEKIRQLGEGSSIFLRNSPLSGTEFLSSISGVRGAVFSEDHDGVVGANEFHNTGPGLNIQNPLIISTSTLRSGGGPTAIEVRPTTNTTSIWDFNKIKLFEYPIYADTSSKQYDIYFRTATTTAEWTANPTAQELWIQCEYWAHDTGATSTRKVKKSTGTVDFAGSSAWQALSVTCQPTQDGIMYLSGYYAKTSEAGQTNYFLMDNTPVIQ